MMASAAKWRHFFVVMAVSVGGVGADVLGIDGAVVDLSREGVTPLTGFGSVGSVGSIDDGGGDGGVSLLSTPSDLLKVLSHFMDARLSRRGGCGGCAGGRNSKANPWDAFNHFQSKLR